jgi:Cu/Ag efflux pump CusA
VKQYQVIVDPDRLRKYNLALQDIFEAVAKNNQNTGGNILERHEETPPARPPVRRGSLLVARANL